MEPKKPRVLVIRGGAIGDFILTLPALRLIRQTISGCHLEVLGYPGIMELAIHAGLADSVRSLEHRSMSLLFAKGATIDPALAEYLCGFNLVVSYLFDPDGVLKGQLEKIGVKTLIECPHSVRPRKGHAAQQLAKPLESLAMYLDEPDWREPLLAEQTARGRNKRIALHLGSGSEKKNWPVENWLQVVQALQKEQPSAEIILITGEAEKERGVSTAEFHATDHWHALPLPELAARLRSCDLFLGHDSGISHLAATCGVPCQLLFGPTDPELWAPPQTNVSVLRTEKGQWELLPPEKVSEWVLNPLNNRGDK